MDPLDPPQGTRQIIIVRNVIREAT